MKKIKDLFCEIKTGQVKVNNLASTIKRLSSQSDEDGFVQVFSANYIAGENHVLFALQVALELFERKTNRLKNPALELLLTVSAADQLESALEKTSLVEGKNNCVFVACAKNEKNLSMRIKEVVELIKFKEKKIIFSQKKVQRAFKISDKQLQTLSDTALPLENAVCEKIALSLLSKN